MVPNRVGEYGEGTRWRLDYNIFSCTILISEKEHKFINKEPTRPKTTTLHRICDIYSPKSWARWLKGAKHASDNLPFFICYHHTQHLQIASCPTHSLFEPGPFFSSVTWDGFLFLIDMQAVMVYQEKWRNLEIGALMVFPVNEETMGQMKRL